MKSNSSTSWSFLTVSCLILVLSINASSQTTEFKSQCEKYVVNCPINISQSSNWMDIVIVQELLKDYLWSQPHANLQDLMKGENRVSWVSFDGDKIYVLVIAYSWPGEDKSKAFKQHSLLLQSEYTKQISLLLQDAFTPKKQIVVDVESQKLSMAIMISSRDLKDKYLRPQYAIGYNAVAIDYSAVRRGIVDAVNQVEGFEINPKTEGTKKSEFSEQKY